MVKLVKKVIAFTAIAAMTVTSFAGCSNKGGTGSTSSSLAPEGKGEVVNLTFLDWESAEMNKAIEASFDQFQAENPNIKVKLNPAPLQDYGIKIQEMIAAKQAPDAFMVGNDMVIKYGTEKLLLELNKYTDKDAGFLDKFYPGVLKSWQIDNKLVGLPGLMNTYGVFYNKKLLAAKNIPFPTKGWTYKEMLENAEKLKDPAQKMYGLYNATPDAFHMGVYAAAAGGPGFCDAIYPITKVQASPQFKEGVELFAEKIKSGAIPPKTFNADNLVGLFMQGKVPMMQYGQWAVDEITRNGPKDLEWGFVPNPTVTKQSTIYDAVGWAIPASTKYPEESYKLLKYIVTKTYEKILPSFPVAPTAYMDSAKPYYQKLKDLGHSDVAEGLDYMLTSPDKQPVRFLESWADKAGKFTDAAWNRIIEGKDPVSKLDEMVRNINDVIPKK